MGIPNTFAYAVKSQGQSVGRIVRMLEAVGRAYLLRVSMAACAGRFRV